MKHVSSLDGVRGFAVLIVMLFHAKVSGFSLGWAGVPLFFCLSGFLITSILLKDKESSFWDYIKRFLINRSLRIFPLFYAYLAVNFALLLATGKPTDGYLWFVTYLQNYYIGINIHTPGILGHTWSLAVEEQFYWLWPLVIFVLPVARMNLVFVSLIILSAISRYVIFQLTGGSHYLINVTLISCIDMLVLGSLFAKIKDEKHAKAVGFILFWAGIALVLFGVNAVGIGSFWTPEGWAGKCWYMFTAFGMVFSSALFYIYRWSVEGRFRLFIRFASSKPLVFTGKISYGLYMWHLLCFSLSNKICSRFGIEADGFQHVVIGFVLSYLVATASFYLFEVHFLKFKRYARGTERSAVTA